MYETFALRTTSKGDITGYRWHVEDPKKVVLIVHGIGEYAGRYDRVAGRFNEKGFAVASMDLRGHGESLGKRGDCAPRADVLDDVSALLAYAQLTYPGKPIILYGHSMGGNIALDYRSRGGMNDVPQGYIITGPWIRLVQPIPKPLYGVMKTLAKLRPTLTVSSDVDEDLLGHPDSVLPYNDDPMVHNRISARCAIDGFETGLKLEKGTLEDNGRAGTIPLLLMHGGSDAICDVQGTRTVAQRLQDQGDKVIYIEWPGLNHEIHNGGGESRGDEVIDRMIQFIETLE